MGLSIWRSVMMQDLAMSILDIAKNAYEVNATEVHINLIDDGQYLTIQIIDNGPGMSESELKEAISPFYTTRKTRKIGLGIPFFKQIAEQCDGKFELVSSSGIRISSSMRKDHIDCPPMGDIGESIATLIQCDPDVELVFKYIKNNQINEFNTQEVKKILDGISIAEPEIIIWVKQTINDLMNS